jgi:repressor LexA
MNEVLPTRQQKVFDFIQSYIAANGYPPSIANITEHLGVFSTFGVRKHIDALIKKGYITRGAGTQRTLHQTGKT